MAVTVTGGTQVVPGVFTAVESLSQSTATVEQAISVTHQITTLSGGTATGFNIDKYNLPDGGEGAEKLIVMLATGEAKIRFGAATTNTMATGGIHNLGGDTVFASATSVTAVLYSAATGAFVFNTMDDYIHARFWNGSWHIFHGNATIATST